MALTFEVQWILHNRYWRLMCECVNNVHIIRGIGHGANLNVGYPPPAGGRPRRGSKSTWCSPPASISGLAPASSLGRSSPQPRPASTLYLLPGHRHLRLRLSSPRCHTSTVLFQILLPQWSHRTLRHCTLTPGKSSGNATNELHSVRYAAEYIQRSNQLHLPEKQELLFMHECVDNE